MKEADIWDREKRFSGRVGGRVMGENGMKNNLMQYAYAAVTQNESNQCVLQTSLLPHSQMNTIFSLTEVQKQINALKINYGINMEKWFL